MFMLEKRPFQTAPPHPIHLRDLDGAEEEPRSASYASRRRPVAPDFYAEFEPEEPFADSVRRAAEEHPDRAVAAASPNSSS